MVEMIMSHKVEILAFLLALSEALAFIPQIESNSIFQMVVGALVKLKTLFTAKA